MLRARPSVAPVDRRPSERATSLWLSAAAALAIGVLTGLIGIGGGFLFVPVLVVLGGALIFLAGSIPDQPGGFQ